ncbi:MAG: hypothetical protein JO278_06475, partial [Dyella sp.]|nr:hypothetical protein [Dyella sp.]
MTGELTPFASMVPALVSEARRRRLGIGIVFALIALAVLVTGLLWPKKFEASTTILAQES